jgi:hypothetical protein
VALLPDQLEFVAVEEALQQVALVELQVRETCVFEGVRVRVGEGGLFTVTVTALEVLVFHCRISCHRGECVGAVSRACRIPRGAVGRGGVFAPRGFIHQV